MGFYWWTTEDADKAKSLGGLVNYNEGKFKSEKQAKFFREKFANTHHTAETLNLYFNIEKKEQEFVVFAEGYVGMKFGKIPVCFVYMCDDAGVVAKYKLKYVKKAGTKGYDYKPDPEQTELQFFRGEQIQFDTDDQLLFA